MEFPGVYPYNWAVLLVKLSDMKGVCSIIWKDIKVKFIPEIVSFGFSCLRTSWAVPKG